jgi:hypothetical protein
VEGQRKQSSSILAARSVLVALEHSNAREPHKCFLLPTWKGKLCRVARQKSNRRLSRIAVPRVGEALFNAIPVRAIYHVTELMSRDVSLLRGAFRASCSPRFSRKVSNSSRDESRAAQSIITRRWDFLIRRARLCKMCSLSRPRALKVS